MTLPGDPLDLAMLSPVAREIATTIARVASDIALVVDARGVIQSVAQGEMPLSPRLGEWVGQRWADVASQGTRNKIDLLLDEALSAGVTRRREVNHPGAVGEDIPVAWTAIRLGDTGPFIAVGRDLRTVAAIQKKFVEAQQQLEREYWQRRQSEQRYRTLFHVARDAVLVVDTLQFEIVEANRAAAALLDSDPAVMIGVALAELLPASARPAVTELLVNARTTGQAGEIRLRLRPDAEPFDVAATPLRVGDREQLMLQARHTDASPAHNGRSDFLEREVDSSPVAVVVTDSAGRVMMANEAFAALAGRNDETGVRGIRLQDLFGDVSQGCTSLLARARERGLASRVPLVVRSGPQLLALEATATMLADGEQEWVGITLHSQGPAPTFAPAWAEGERDVTAIIGELAARLGQVPMDDLLSDAAGAIETHLIELAMQRCDGDMGAASSMLGLSPVSLAIRLQRLGLTWGRSDGGNVPPSIN